MENDMTLDQAIQHLEIDVLPNHCNGNEACYRQHNQLYEWLKELRERRAKEGVRYDDGKDRNIGIAEGDRLCLYYDKPFTDEKGKVIGIGYYHCPIDAMADSVEELQSNGMGGGKE